MRKSCLSYALVFFLAAALSACGGNNTTSDQGTASLSKQMTRSDKSAAALASPYQNSVQALYIAYFGRPADPAGLANFESTLQAANAPPDIPGLASAYAGSPAIQSLVNAFGSSKESQALYGSSNPTAFVTAVFENVLGREPLQAGLDFWVNAISSGSVSQGDAALAIMSGGLSNTTTQGLLDTQLINNRLAAATYFTSVVSTDNATSAYSGATAAASARSMLSTVTATTNSTTYQTAANSTLASLMQSAGSYTISGSVTGLSPGAQLVLNNNGTDSLTVSANGAFTFSKPVTIGSYFVTVATLPSGENCSVANYHGSGISSNVTDLNVTCATNGFTVSGSVSGLASGQQLILLDNGSDSLTINANGTFRFASAVPYNGTYAVTVGTQPYSQYCTVANGTGAGVTANIASVQVTCSTNNFNLGGTVSGLEAGTQLALEDNGGNLLAIGADGPFSFSGGVAANGSYNVTVLTQPQNQTCTVSNGFGAGVLSNISSIVVNCVPNNSTFTIGGAVSGLLNGSQITLQNNGANALTLASNGPFTFSTPVALNGSYSVTVGTQPTGQTCSVSSMSGSGVVANITSVQVICSSITYTVGGTVSGLASGTQLVLYNNNYNSLLLSSNGAFTFSTPVAYGGSYSVIVGTQPTGQTCTANNRAGSNVTANINTINIICSPSSYAIGGYVSGLAYGTQVTLLDNGTDAVTINANTSFSFPTPIAYQGSYAVTVGTQPIGQFCVLSNANGTSVSANVSSVSVYCNTANYTIGGTVTGLSSGNQVTLQTGTQTVTVSNNGNFTFPIPLTANGSYSVSIAGISSGESCVVTNGSGANVTSTVNNVTVACTTAPTIGYAYILDTSNNMVRQFNVTSNGLTSTTNTVGTDLNPCAITRHPSGQYVYVANYGSSTISQYSVGAGGVLTSLSPAHVQTGAGPCGIVIDPAGQYAYAVVSGSNQTGPQAQWIAVSVFSIGSDGTLTAQPSLGISSIYSAYGLSGASISLTPNGQYAYINLPGSTSPYQYSVSAGVLTPLSPSYAGANSDNSFSASAFTINPQGNFAYYAGSYNSVARYSIGSNGTLTLLADVVSGSGAPSPRTVAYSPSGNYAYVVDSGNSSPPSGDVRQFAVNADGTFTPLNPSTLYVVSPLYSLVFDATGQYALAVLGPYGSSVGQYALNPNGTLNTQGAPILGLSFSAGQMITTGL